MYQRNFLIRMTFLYSALGCVFGLSSTLLGQDEDSNVVRHVDFDKDVKPIIAKSCLKCHGTDDQEGGVDFGDVSTLDEFIKPGNRGESRLFKVITSDDVDEQMPPPDDVADGEVEALTKPEIALIALWIDEGAIFGEQPKAPDEATESMAMRVWRFVGCFHPAVVHFPIAFFLLGAVFVVIFRRNMALANEASYYCLALGALAALVTVALGWSFGLEKSQAAIADMDGKLFWHRWSGVGVAALAVIVWFLAWRQRSEEYSDGGGSWKLGLILLAAVVGIVGHQGGELVYGKNLYQRKLDRYLPELYSIKKDATDGGALSKTAEEQDDQVASDKANEGKPVDTAQADNEVDKTKQEINDDSDGKSAVDPVASQKTEIDEPQESNEDAAGAAVESKSSDAETNEESQVGG